jgi:hypothetical protein
VCRIPGADRVRQVFADPSYRGDVEVALVPVAAGRIRIGNDERLRRDRRRSPGRESQLVPEDSRAGDRQDYDRDQRGMVTLTPSAASS